MMDRHPLKKKTTNTKHQRIDRFVTSRESFRELSLRCLWPAIKKSPDTEVWYSKYLQQKKYASYLNESFGLTPPNLPEPVVNSCVQLSSHGSGRVLDTCGLTWPCIPRDRKFLSVADSILDLPNYNAAAFPELLDWNCDNVLVAALGRFYHKWSWNTQTLINQGVSEYDILCCKFHPKGKLLALGTLRGLVEVHDSDIGKSIDCKACMDLVMYDRICSTTAVAWSPTGKSYVMGCSRGLICSFSTSGEIISYIRVPCRRTILLLRISPDARFLAIVAVNSGTVYLLTWPKLEVYSEFSSEWTVKAITWHPWRSALLGVGAVTLNASSRILIWDIHSEKCHEHPIGCTNYYLDTMLFSRKSGELVISLWSPDRVNKSRLVVMSDPKTAVDQWGEDYYFLDRVRHMTFNSDGTLLATATAEEDLIIWNFLPENKKKTKCKNFFSRPVFLDETTTGFSLRRGFV